MSNNYLDYWIIAVIIILNLDLPDKLYLTFATEDKVLEILRAIDTTKATGFDKFLEEFLKDFFDKISLRSNGPNVWKYGPENTLLCVACVKSQFPSDFFQTFVNCWIKTNKKKKDFQGWSFQRKGFMWSHKYFSEGQKDLVQILVRLFHQRFYLSYCNANVLKKHWWSVCY